MEPSEVLAACRARQLDRGLEAAQAALRPGSASLLDEQAWALLALLLSAQHRDQAALAVVDAGTKVLAGSQTALLHKIRSRLLLAQGDEQGALQTCTEQLARLPAGSVPGLLDLAEVYTQLGEDEQAEACLREAGGWSPEWLVASAGLDTVRGDTQAATAAAQTAQALDAEHAPASHQLGCLTAAQGGREGLSEAKVHFSDAAQADPWHAKAWYCLGVVCKEQGQLDDARDCLTVALALQQTQPVVPFPASSS